MLQTNLIRLSARMSLWLCVAWLIAGCGTFEFTGRVEMAATPTMAAVAQATWTPTPVVEPTLPTATPIPVEGASAPTAVRTPTVMPTAPAPAAASLLGADVEAVLVTAADQAPVYSGPGTEYEQINALFGGLIFPISGISADGNWWRLVSCYDDTNQPAPECWISTAPDVTQPSELIPHGPPAAVPPPTAAPARQSGPVIYDNAQYGFSLSLPPTWQGYEVTVNPNPTGATICFTFVGSVPICVLQIDVYTRPAWESLGNRPADYYVAENGQYIFAAGPYGPQCVQLDAFQCERYQEIPEILSTFQTIPIGQ